MLLYFDVVAAELDTDGNLMLVPEFTVHDALHKTRFTDSHVANDYQLEKIFMDEFLVFEVFVRHSQDVIDLILLHFQLLIK